MIDWLVWAREEMMERGSKVSNQNEKLWPAPTIDWGVPWWDDGVMNGDDGVDQNVHEPR